MTFPQTKRFFLRENPSRTLYGLFDRVLREGMRRRWPSIFFRDAKLQVDYEVSLEGMVLETRVVFDQGSWPLTQGKYFFPGRVHALPEWQEFRDSALRQIADALLVPTLEEIARETMEDPVAAVLASRASGNDAAVLRWIRESEYRRRRWTRIYAKLCRGKESPRQ